MKRLIFATVLACMLAAATSHAGGNGKNGHEHYRLPIKVSLGLGIQGDPCDAGCTGYEKDCGCSDDSQDTQGFLAGRLTLPVAKNVSAEGELSRLMESEWDLGWRVGLWVHF